MNLIGIVVPGERVAAVPGKNVVYPNEFSPVENGIPVAISRHEPRFRNKPVVRRTPSVPISDPAGTLRLF
jgi:hypothetical protein